MTAQYAALISVSVFAMLILAMIVARDLTLSRRQQQRLLLLCGTVGLSALCEFLGILLESMGPAWRVPHILVKTVELSIAPSIGVIGVSILCPSRLMKPMCLLLIAGAVLMCLSAFTGLVFRVDAQNVYSHGDWYWVYVLLYSLGAVYFVAEAFISMGRYKYSGAPVLLGMTLLVVGSLVWQFANSAVKIDWITLSITAVFIYIINAEMIQQTDALTLLLNRRGYENHLSHLQEPTIVQYFDLDGFKQVNDRWGHAEGDECLRITGQCMHRAYAAYGRCYRIGGDEFCVLLRASCDLDALNGRFLQLMAQKRALHPILPEVSFGSALFEPGSDVVSETVKQADQAMYRCKQEKQLSMARVPAPERK